MKEEEEEEEQDVLGRIEEREKGIEEDGEEEKDYA